jgi:AcrR family transcriptional regulator
LDVIAGLHYIPAGMETDLLPHPTRGRPREFCTDQALVAALRVFWQRGYEGASLTELTEAMGITRPSLYAAFGNKEALFRKALDLYEREKLDYINQALDAPTARGVAERLLRGTLMMQCCPTDPRGCLSMIAVAGCAPQGEAVKHEVSSWRTKIDAAILARFERAQAEGDLPEGFTPVGVGRLLNMLVYGLNAMAAAGIEPDQLEAGVETALKVWPGR